MKQRVCELWDKIWNFSPFSQSVLKFSSYVFLEQYKFNSIPELATLYCIICFHAIFSTGLEAFDGTD